MRSGVLIEELADPGDLTLAGRIEDLVFEVLDFGAADAQDRRAFPAD